MRRKIAIRPPSADFTVIDLFAGAGGLSEGFRQAGFAVVAGTDHDPDAAATYARNFPEARTIGGDIESPAVREQLVHYAHGIGVVVGGPPCQAYSQVRNHARIIDDPRNALYREFVALLRATEPPAFVMENVTGIDQMGVRDQIARDLSLDGTYRVMPQVLDAADFGVPQSRKRLLFVGVRRDVAEAPPQLVGSGATDHIDLRRIVNGSRSQYQLAVETELFGRRLARALADPRDASVVSAADALSDLVDIPVGNRDDELPYPMPPRSEYQRVMRLGASVLTNVQVPRINADTAARLRGIPQGGNHRDLSTALLRRYLSGQRWGQDNGSGLLSRRHFYAYRRLHPGMWAWTLNTKADSVYHYSRERALSVREFARLQSFPDRFVFTTDARRGAIHGRRDGGPAHSRYRQVGNAVPPLLARAVAQELLVVLRAWRARTTPH